MDLEHLSDKQLDLLKIEMEILTSKISSVVDTLWKVRTAAITLWSAVLSLGLGALSQTKEPVFILLVLSCFLPILFIDIDARNNQWYRRLTNRESAIQQFINDPNFENSSLFPIYDLAGKYTFKGNKQLAWEFSRMRNFVDPIPLTFYGSQLIFSSAICTIYAPIPWKYIFLPIALIVVSGLVLISQRVKRAYGVVVSTR
jgi:hypothetical protein